MSLSSERAIRGMVEKSRVPLLSRSVILTIRIRPASTARCRSGARIARIRSNLQVCRSSVVLVPDRVAEHVEEDRLGEFVEVG